MKMMLSGLVMFSLVLAVPAQAAQAQGSSAAKAGDQKQVAQAIEKQQATVKQLQSDVSREEGRSHEADAKLKQQDQTIADLQQQLKALQGTSPDSGHPAKGG
jgi:septal ring factor EnvC (AmiA/AmiB activator)